MNRDNITREPIAAFRYYGQIIHHTASALDAEDVLIIAAVASTLRHLQIENRMLTIEIIRKACFDLPPGNMPRGTITKSVTQAADALNANYTTAWRELRRGCRLYELYHSAFTSKSRE